jgi:hypothetical protein
MSTPGAARTGRSARANLKEELMSSEKPDVEVRMILQHQVATFEVDGGFARRPAPCDGLIVETTVRTIFVPMEQVAAAVDEWRKARAACPATPGAATTEAPRSAGDDERRPIAA